MTKPTYTILVNSSDNFEDCWNPFFKLYEKYWGDDSIPILLNTEFKTGYAYGELPITCTAANSQNPERSLTWSECLINALAMVQTDLVLYMQEDYFIEGKVDEEVINEMIEIMQQEPNIKYIGLTHFGNMPPFINYEKNQKLSIVQNTRYRISTQAGIWRKETLLSYLKPNENGWMFEIFGTQRAKKRDELFLTLNREQFNEKNPVILYTHTGIIKGKWHQAMPALFSKNGLAMDFSKRGIYREKPFLLRKLETGFKLMKNPYVFYQGMRGKE